ncbi:hypothetical protein KIPB_012994, partial [Kipferlia bialata]|eukprot:g12994.t1
MEGFGVPPALDTNPLGLPDGIDDLQRQLAKSEREHVTALDERDKQHLVNMERL